MYSKLWDSIAVLLLCYAGCKLMCFPGAFNMTTGPAHWKLLLRARYVLYCTYVAVYVQVEDDLGSFAAFPVVLSFGFPLRTSLCYCT